MRGGMRPLWRTVAAAVLVAGLVGALGSVGAGQAGAQTGLTAASFVQTWSVAPLDDAGEPIAESSPTVATLDGEGPSVVVGDRFGQLYAYHLSNGSAVSGWPVNVGTPIDSTPSVWTGQNGQSVVYVGSGNASDPDVGGASAWTGSGRPVELWAHATANPPSDNAPAVGVQASLTVANFAATGQGFRPGVFSANLGQEADGLSLSSGSSLPGWPFFTADSDFSTAAAADLYGTGTDFVVGGASTAGEAYSQDYPDGGHLRILNSEGGLICNYDTNQEVDSSPAVGAILAGGATGIVVGTGSYYPGVSDSDRLDAFNTSCGIAWSDRLAGYTSSSPALAEVLGNGQLQVVEGTDCGAAGSPAPGCTVGGTGSVYVLNASNGAVIWQASVTGRVIGSVVTADLTGDGYQDLLVPTTFGTDVLDGRSGQLITVLSTGGYQNSPLVTDDPNGTIGITIAGYNGNNRGVIYHYEIPGSDGALAVAAGSWPMFHHDPQLSGTTTVIPLDSKGECSVPAGARRGYDLVAGDGGIFSFGQSFCGSTGGVRLAHPVVGGALSPSTGGYWLDASDGGVFAFGSAGFFGSTGADRLAAPVVGMAATPDGRGYWLLGADGGVFDFGDARDFGSAAGHGIRSRFVGIAATADGGGYWLVAADGEVFAFGDAQYLGSAEHVKLTLPIVGIAEDRATGGYWLVASDGGVFAYNAPFLGSTGGIHLAKPIVGITATADGRGYWLVASDGGVFGYGDAGFFGSTGGLRLASPIVGLLGFSG